MEGAQRDDTQDWLLPGAATPPLVSELEARIDEAMIIAKASEKAVMAVGDAALDAARRRGGPPTWPSGPRDGPQRLAPARRRIRRRGARRW